MIHEQLAGERQETERIAESPRRPSDGNSLTWTPPVLDLGHCGGRAQRARYRLPAPQNRNYVFAKRLPHLFHCLKTLARDRFFIAVGIDIARTTLNEEAGGVGNLRFHVAFHRPGVV